MLSHIKLTIIAVLVAALTACTFVMMKMEEQLDRRKERIDFLEVMVKEQSASFKNLQDSCFLSQQYSEKNADVTQEQHDKAEALKKEIAEIQKSLDNTYFAGGDGTKTGANSAGDSGVAKDNFGGKHDTETRGIASINSKLDAGLVRLLDKAYCEAAPTSVRCSSK